MSRKLYAQFNEDMICITVGTPNITGVEATYENIGMKYEDGVWVNPNEISEEKESVIPETPAGGGRENRITFVGSEVPSLLKGGTF